MANEQIQFPGESVDVLANQVHDPVFFDKLANDWHIEPRTPQEREQLLELATLVREAKDGETVKAASSDNGFLTSAIDSLKQAMVERGYNAPPTSDIMAIKNAAAQAAQNPALQKAALDYGYYLANLAK